jgi:hypothetical protein
MQTKATVLAGALVTMSVLVMGLVVHQAVMQAVEPVLGSMDAVALVMALVVQLAYMLWVVAAEDSLWRRMNWE